MNPHSYAFVMGGLLSFSVRDLESSFAPESVDALDMPRE